MVVTDSKQRRTKEVIRGTRTGNGLFKGVVTNCDLYIGKCDSTVTTEILSNYIKSEYNIKVFACDCLNEYEGSKSYKVKLSIENRNKLPSSSMWPDNIVVRKFYNPKTSKNDRANQH